MNLILLFEEDFIAEDVVRLTGRRREHMLAVHGAAVGDELVVGREGGKIGRGVVLSDAIEMRVTFDREPPPPLGVTLVVALPRPKVLHRLIASATSMGVKRIYLVNAWRVEKSYWKSPRLASLREPAVLGLEQARDTILPLIEQRRLFRPFVEDELPALARGTRKLVAHPGGSDATLSTPLTLAIGPEGGWIEKEIESLQAIGFETYSMGPRILRMETAVAAILGAVSA